MIVTVQSEIERTPRAIQLEGLFGIERERISRVSWDVVMPIDERPWQVGLIVGPSGSGKSTIARTLWPEQMAHEHEWPTTRPVIDGFPEAMSTKDVTALLSSVGFSSPPSWLRPRAVLSTGEGFRADVALSIAHGVREGVDPIVIDEFTSVIDRTVAQVGSAAIAKTIRRSTLPDGSPARFVAVTCHADVIEWLQPDWIYRPDTATFEWRSVQPRPSLDLTVERAPREVWRAFAPHHYLSRNLPSAVRMFVAYLGDEPVACYAVMRFVHKTVKNAWQGSRLVVLPDYQGIGVGLALSTAIGGIARGQRTRLFSTSAHPARIAALSRHPAWKCTMRPQFKNAELSGAQIRRHSGERMVTSFEYVGPPIESELGEHLSIYERRSIVR